MLRDRGALTEAQQEFQLGARGGDGLASRDVANLRNRQLVRRTEHRYVDVTDLISQAGSIGWWTAMTEAGGGGMVVGGGRRRCWCSRCPHAAPPPAALHSCRVRPDRGRRARAAGALERRGGSLLVRVLDHDAAVDVDRYRPLRAHPAAVLRGHRASVRPGRPQLVQALYQRLSQRARERWPQVTKPVA